jgi:UDP-glucuronate decarboxylase
MLELAKKLNIRILQASTSEIYGSLKNYPLLENDYGNVNPIGVRACYEESKRCAETLVMNYHRQYKMKIKLVRIFNTYGPRILPDDGRVVSTFIVQALKNENIQIFGDGTQVRSFCYVDDMVKGLIRMMESNSNFIGPVNLGHPNGFTISDVAMKIIRLTHSNSKIIYKDALNAAPLNRQPDIRLAIKELKWKPETIFEEGLKKTIHYFDAL